MRITPRLIPIQTDDEDSIELKASHIGLRVHELPAKEQERAYVKENARRLQPGMPSMVNLATHADFRTAFYKRQYATQLTVINHTPGVVISYDRLGVPYIIEVDTRTSGYPQSCVIIRKDILFDSKAAADRMLAGLKALGQLNSHDLRGVRTQIEKERNHISIHGGRIELEYVITYDELQRAGGVVYHSKTDVLVSILGFNETCMHPCSSEHIDTGISAIAHSDKMDDVGLVLRYVNQDPNARPLYTNFANKIFTLYPQIGHPQKSLETTQKAKKTADSTVDSDAYIEFIYTARVDNPAGHREMSYTRLCVDEAKERYGLFDSYGEAMNAKASFETVLRKQKDAIDSLQQELKAQKALLIAEFEIERRALNDKLRDKTIEVDELKRSNAAEVEQLKVDREAQAHQQKLSFESVKFVISISTLILGLIPVIIKLKQSTKT